MKKAFSTPSWAITPRSSRTGFTPTACPGLALNDGDHTIRVCIKQLGGDGLVNLFALQWFEVVNLLFLEARLDKNTVLD